LQTFEKEPCGPQHSFCMPYWPVPKQRSPIYHHFCCASCIFPLLLRYKPAARSLLHQICSLSSYTLGLGGDWGQVRDRFPRILVELRSA
jgi:hypothetical protein